MAIHTARQMLGLLGLLVVTACVKWQAVPVQPKSFTPSRKELRVTRKDGWRATLAFPAFVNDTIRGTRSTEPFDSIAIPASEVRSVAVPIDNSENVARAGVLAAFIGIFAGLLLYFRYGVTD